jgi:DNA-directed RNA polymerase subunit RPC12/RpoP
MEIICEKCNARLNIPDEKIPSGQQATVSCPKCQNKLMLNARGSRTKSATPAIEGKAESHLKETASDDDNWDDDASLDFFEEDAKLALVMGSGAQQVKKLGRTIEELGYRCVLAKNTRDAISKMRLHYFDLVVLSDGFDGIDLAQSPILQHINNLSMSVRRRCFLALVADEFKTMDNMMAFAMSANMVINGGDLDRLTSIMQHAISDNEKFYKVFMDTMVEVGKA